MRVAPFAVISTLIVAVLFIGGYVFLNQSKTDVINNPSPSSLESPAQSPSSLISPIPETSPFPSSLPTKYITTVDWPPKLQTINEPFTCTQAGSDRGRAGETSEIVINGETYCVTKITEGAAGSVYTQYAYAVASDNQTKIYTFSLRFPQCGNYGDVQKSECEKEKEQFDVDNLADSYIKSQSI